jgi:hypothetical protein
MELEIELVRRAYLSACTRKLNLFAIVFTQIDVWTHGSFEELKSVAKRLVQDLPPGGIAIRLSVANALDPISATACLKEVSSLYRIYPELSSAIWFLIRMYVACVK